MTQPVGFVRQFTSQLLNVQVFTTPESLAQAAAQEAYHYIGSLLAKQESVSIVFACATSQVMFLNELTALAGIDWRRIRAFHMDEYLGIDPGHRASFRRFLREKVINKVHPGSVDYLEGNALEPIAECDRYGALLKAAAIDLCCLGIGENGHIAFNDPPVASFQDQRAVKIVQLDERCRQQQVGEGFFPTLDSVPKYAMTLTIPTLCAARRMICVVPDQRKAEAVKHALQGPIDTSCPASHLRTQSHCALFLDQNSASAL